MSIWGQDSICHAEFNSAFFKILNQVQDGIKYVLYCLFIISLALVVSLARRALFRLAFVSILVIKGE